MISEHNEMRDGMNVTMHMRAELRRAVLPFNPVCIFHSAREYIAMSIHEHIAVSVDAHELVTFKPTIWTLPMPHSRSHRVIAKGIIPPDHFKHLQPLSSLHLPSSRLLIRPPHHPSKLLKPDLLPHHRPLGLILLVNRHAHDPDLIDPPAANLPHEGVKLPPLQIQPALGDGALDGAAALADGDGDADAHELLEAVDVGDEVGVEVVRVERVPEVAVGALLEEGVEVGELLDGFGERGVGDGGGGEGGGRGRGGGGGRGRGEDVRGEEVQAEGEVGGGEDGEGFDEDIGDGFVAGEVRVELVSVRRRRGGLLVGGCLGGAGGWRR